MTVIMAAARGAVVLGVAVLGVAVLDTMAHLTAVVTVTAHHMVAATVPHTVVVTALLMADMHQLLHRFLHQQSKAVFKFAGFLNLQKEGGHWPPFFVFVLAHG
jgi:hypothetical protein